MSEHHPSSTHPTQGEYDLVLVDQSHDARNAARNQAETRLTNELNEGGRIRRFVSGIWKGNIAKDYYREKYQREAHQEIVASQDILIHESQDDRRRYDAMDATMRRFQSDYEEMVHTEAGETRNEVESGSNVAGALKDIIRKYAEGRLDDNTLREERARVLQAYRDENGNPLAGEGTIQIDNMLEIAQAVRGAVTHGESVDTIIAGMRVISGESRSGVRTEAVYTKVDAVIEKVGKSKLGLFVNPETLTAATSIAASLLRFGSERAIGAAAMTLIPGAAGGILAGLREKKRIKDDRAQHAREMAQGKTSEDDATNREAMEQTRYETRNAVELIDALNVHLEDGALGDDDAVHTALAQLAAIQTREHLSDTKGIDLIAYSDADSIEDERFRLALARAQVKVAVGDKLDDETRHRLGLDTAASINDLIADRSAQYIEYHEADMDAKDKAFRKLRNRRVAQAAAKGVAMGLTFGLIAQETIAGMSSTREGLVEQLWAHDTQLHDGRLHETLLQGVFDGGEVHVPLQEGAVAAAAAIESSSGEDLQFNRQELGENGIYRVSENISLRDDGEGLYSVIGADGALIADEIKIRPNGGLSEHMQRVLEGKGITVEDISHTRMVEQTVTKEVGLDRFMENHRGDTTQVTRELWYDNDTPAPVFEQNELGLHWGGQGSSGVTENGAIQMNIATMQADGSFHGNEAANWASEAQGGNLKLAISPSSETQGRPFLLDIDANGNVTMPPDSPAAQFFSIENGQAVFDGRYAEVVQMVGENENGVERIRPLATLVGNDSIDQLQDTITTKEPQRVPRYEISMAPAPESAGPAKFVEMAPSIPVVNRRSLEALKTTLPPYGSSYERMTPEILRRAEADRSPRLKQDPQARLELGQELGWHDRRLRRDASADYLQEIGQTVANTPELANLDNKTKAIVTIPVGAALEAENIYRTLSLYGKQDEKEAVESTLILLHVNWIDADESDPVKAAKIQKTKQEIERARRDYPDLNISIIQSVWSKQRLDEGGYGDRLIGHVSQKMYDAAMSAANNAIREGRMDASDDVLIIKNDADALGMDRHYLRKMIATFENHPENDVFTGAIRWGAHRSKDLPGFGFVTQFLELTRIAAQRSTVQGFQSTFGVNAAVRMSTFAAVGGIGHYSDQKESAPDDLAIGERVAAARNAVPQKSAQSGRLFDRIRLRRRHSGSPASIMGQSYGANGQARGRFDYHRHVGGADIDTDADRMEAKYVKGLPITRTWDGVHEGGGFTGRSEGMVAGERENLRTNPDAVVTRIEENLSALISEWLTDPKQVAAGLAFMTPSASALGGVPPYRITRRASRSELRFTPEGKQWLVNKLTRNSRGQFDAYGNRKMRMLYNQVPKNAKIQPVRAVPKMVGGVV